MHTLILLGIFGTTPTCGTCIPHKVIQQKVENKVNIINRIVKTNVEAKVDINLEEALRLQWDVLRSSMLPDKCLDNQPRQLSTIPRFQFKQNMPNYTAQAVQATTAVSARTVTRFKFINIHDSFTISDGKIINKEHETSNKY